MQKRRHFREAGSELPKSGDTTEMANAKFEASKSFGESAPLGKRIWQRGSAAALRNLELRQVTGAERRPTNEGFSSRPRHNAHKSCIV
jgi:hypothetical protein